MRETQFLGALVIGLGSLAGLFAVFGKLLAKAVQIATEFHANLDSIKSELASLQDTIPKHIEHEREGRRKLWTALENLETVVAGHKDRITQIETKIKLHHENGG